MRAPAIGDRCPECGAAVTHSIEASFAVPLRFSSHTAERFARIVFTAERYGIVALSGARFLDLARYERIVTLVVASGCGAVSAWGVATCNALTRVDGIRAHTRVAGAPKFIGVLAVTCGLLVLSAAWTSARANFRNTTLPTTLATGAIVLAILGVVGLGLQTLDLTPKLLAHFSWIVLVGVVLLTL